MSIQRFLGGAWASVHGPADPDMLLKYCLDRRFKGLGVGPGPRPRDWAGLAPALDRLPAEICAVRVCGVHEAEKRADGGLASTNAGDREASLQMISEAVALASRLRCTKVILEPGLARVVGDQGRVDLGDPAHRLTPDAAMAQMARRNAGLSTAVDAACRSLYALTRRFPEVTFCLTGSRNVLGLGEPKALELVFEDLKRTNLRYWHDAPVAARRAELLSTQEGEWLERFAPRLSGMTVGDTADGALYLPPGAGRVDYPLLATYTAPLTRGFPVLMELDPSVEPGEIAGAQAFLDKVGL